MAKTNAGKKIVSVSSYTKKQNGSTKKVNVRGHKRSTPNK